MSMTAARTLRRAFLLASIVCTPLGCASTAPPAKQTTAPTPAPTEKRTLVFALTTGLEDPQAMQMAFRHARVAADQHTLGEVVVLVYSRGVQSLDAGAARPPGVAKLAQEAMAAGVKVLVCAHSMQMGDVPAERLDPKPTQIVPQAIVALVGYVAKGAAVVRY